MHEELLAKKWGQILARAGSDGRFKKRLLSEPVAVLKEHGVEMPQGVEVRIVEDTPKVFYLKLPLLPAEGELSDSELAGVDGGTSFGSIVRKLGETLGGNLPTKGGTPTLQHETVHSTSSPRPT